MDYPNVPDWKYVIVDLNKDGQDRLLIGDEKFVSAIYYLENQNLAYFTQHIFCRWFRLRIWYLENGQVSYADWQSTRPEMNLSLYSFGKNGVQKIKTSVATKSRASFDISSEKQLSNTGWKELN